MTGEPSIAGPAAPPTFGARLRVLREAAGLSQEMLAERAGLSTDAVSALERGTRTRPYPATIRALAAALELSPREHAELVAAVPPRGRPERGTPGKSSRRRLPRPATRLLGREQDIATVSRLLTAASPGRLVTLTGMGGIGKTRLALEVAEQVGPGLRDGAILVELAPVLDDALIVPEIARAVGREDGEAGRGSDDGIIAGLVGLEALLVLDNVEHLRGAGLTVARVLSACPDLRILATGRAPLRISGETEYRVQPLALPHPAVTDPAALESFAAASLLIERGRAVRQDLVVRPHDVPALVGICHRLAGVPLALELASAGLRVLDPAALLARLDDVMSRPGAIDLPARQSSLRATLDWSYELLPPQDRMVFRRASVFVGGFTLEALEAVAGGPDALSATERLAAQSLLVVPSAGAGADLRYTLLEPVGQYARSLLEADRQETEAARLRHAEHFLTLAERAAQAYRGPEQVRWLGLVDAEEQNLWSALTWSLQTGRAEVAARFVSALWWYGWVRGRREPRLRLAEEILRHDLPGELRAQVLVAAASLADPAVDVDTIESRYLEAWSLAESCGARETVTHAASGAGLAALKKGELASAEGRFRDALAAADAIGEDGQWSSALTSIFLGTTRRLRGDLDGAADDIRRGLEIAQTRGDSLVACLALHSLARAKLAAGDRESARSALAEAVELSRHTGDAANLSVVVDTLAVLESPGDDQQRVARLLGAAESLLDLVGVTVSSPYAADVEQRDRAALRARAVLGDAGYRQAFEAGHSLTYDGVVDLAGRQTPSPS